MLCYCFSLEAVLQGLARNNRTEKQVDAEIQTTLRHASAWKLTEEKMVIVANYKDRFKL